MRAACESEPTDWITIRHVIHKMKATIAMMGISQLQPVIAQLEKYTSQETRLPEIMKLIDNISNVCNRVNIELQARLELFQQEAS
jgi:hypothetical protein